MNRVLFIRRSFHITTLLLLSMAYSNFCLGQTNTFTGTGNFSVGARWSLGVPVAGHNLVINGACTVDNFAGTNNVVYGTLVIGSTLARTLNWVGGGTNRLNVSNVSSGFAGSTLDMTGGGTLIIRGTWSSTNLAFTPGAALGTGTIEIQSSMTLPAAYAVYNNLIINGAATTVTLGANFTANTSLVITSGTLNLSTFTANRTTSGAGPLTVSNGATLRIGGTNGFPTNYTTRTLGSTSSTVDYNGTAQTVLAQDYCHLTLSTSGVKTFGTVALSNIRVGGALTISGTATADLLTWTTNVSYFGSGAQTIPVLTYYDLSAITSGTKTLAGNVVVNNNLTVTGTAILDLLGFTANRASAGGTLTVSNTTRLKVGGTNTLPSNYSAHAIGATSTIEYSGTTQSVAVLNSAQDYGNLTVSGSGTKTLAGSENVVGTLAFTGGTITTGANTLYVNATGTVSRSSGHVIGNFQKSIATGATSKTFEVGDANNYTPVTVVFASVTTAGDLTVSVAGVDHANIVTSTINPSLSVNRNWSLTNSGIIFTTYGATFTFVPGTPVDLDAGANTSAFIVGKYSAGSWTYPTVGTKTGTTTQATGMTAFSDFQLGEFAASYNISGTVFEDMNYGGGLGRSFASSSGVARPGARVEVFDSGGTYQTFTTTDGSGNYTFSLQAGTYTVRVVNNTVTTSRGVLLTTTPNQTFRTDASSGAAVAVMDHVGGEAPGLIDAFDGSTTLAVLTTGSNTPQSITNVALSSGNISGVDFGYCFNVIVNANNQGQGSLRRVLIYANAMPNTGLAQSGLTAGIDNAIFMLADGTARPGLTASYPSQFVSGVATISLATAYPTITDPVILDASLQPGYTNVPMIELNGAAVAGAGFTITAGSSTVRGFIINRFTDAATGIGVSISAAGNNTITGNYIGTNALGTVASPNTRTGILINSNNNIVGGLTAGAGNLISGNGKGVVIVGGAGNAILSNTIYDNTGIGIDLTDDGVTVNDGTKSGALVNSGMDMPVFTTMTLGGTTLTISGYVGSAAGQATFASASVEVFKADNDASGFGEGQTLLGTLTTDASGNFSGALTVSLAIGDKVTGTATDGSNNTSEFAANVTVTAPPIKTFTGTGSFSDASKWTGGTVPVAGEDLVIDGASTVDNNSGTDNITFGTLTIGTATGRTLSWATSGTNRLNVSNVSAGAAASILDMTNGGTLIIRGTWTSANLTFTPGAGTMDIRSTITLPAAYSTYNNLVINGSSNTVTAGVGIGVTNFTINSGTVNLNTLTLTTTGTAVYTGGTINNGTVTSSGVATTFSGTVFGAIVNATSDALYLNGSTFNNTVTLTKNGATDILCTGGNTFNNTATIVKGGTGYLVLGNSAPDIFSASATFTNFGSNALFFAFNSPGNQFNGDVTINNTGTGSVNGCYGSLATATYNENIILNNTSATGVSFGATGGGSTLAATKTLTIGATGFNAGPLYLYFFNQMGTTPQSLTLTGTAAFIPGYTSIFNGNVNFVAPQVLLNGATFNGTAYIEKNGATQNNSLGGNVFNQTTTLVNSSSSSTAHFVLGYPTGVDTFNGDLTLINTGTAGIYPAFNTAGHQFNGNIILNQTTGAAIYFNGGTGTSTLAAGKTISVGGSGFSSGTLNLPRFTQAGNTAQTFSLTGAASLHLGPATTFDGNVNFVSPQVLLNGATFNGTAYIEKNGATQNNSLGGNVFNQTTTLVNSSSSSTAHFVLGYPTGVDTFNGDLTLINTGTAGIYPAFNTAGHQFNGNIILNQTTGTGINFCGGTGTATLATGKAISVGGSGFSSGALNLTKFTQTGTTAQTFSLTGTASLLIGPSSTFNGNVNFTAPQMFLNGGTYNGTASFTKSGATNNNSDGGNIFASTATITNSGAGWIAIGYFSPDIFNGATTLSNNSTGGLYVAHGSAGTQFNGNVTYNNFGSAGIYNYWGATSTVAYNGDIVVNNTSTGGVYFGVLAGSSATLAATKTISIGGSGFNAGTLHLSFLTQIGATSQTLSLAGTATLQIGPASTFNGNVSFTAPQLYVNGSTYNGAATLTKNGATDNTSDGGNTFNSTATITNNGTGFLRLANLTADDFNGDATFMQTGSGLLQPAYATNNTFAGNISTAGTATAITFGAGAGTVTLNGTGAQSMSGSMPANFNDITVTNTATPGVSVQNDQNLLGVLTLAANVVFDADGTGNTAIFKLISTGDNPTQDASVAVLPSGSQVSGNVTVQRFMTIEGPNSGRIYRYISSPIQNGTVADLQQEIPVSGSFTNSSVCSSCSTNGQSLFAYDETVITDISGNGTADQHDGYIDFPAVTNTETFQPGEGYALYVRGNILGSALWDLRGPINSGNITPLSFPITFTSSGTLANDGWNLVGNPFPSTIDWNAASGWTKTNLDATIYITDNGNASQQYATWNGVTGTNGGTRNIAMGQGFWVKGNGSGAPVLQANENIKNPGTQTSFFREKSLENLLRIALVKGTTRDEAVIHFRDDATKEFDSQADALKLMNSTFNIFTAQEDGTNLAINSMPFVGCNAIIRLNIGNVSTGNYQMDFSEYESFPETIVITLSDKFTSVNINPRESGSYNFSITADSASYSSDRFKISFVTIPVNPDFVVSVMPVCEGSDAHIQIDNSQKDAAYAAMLNGISVSTPVVGNGGEISIAIPQDKLTSGQNLINVRSSIMSCISGATSRSVVLNVLEKYEVTFVEHGRSCHAGVARLAAFGAPENGYYNWYESIESEVPITDQHGSVFVTPVLLRSTTYYVSVANILGCEGLREPVFAEIVQLEPAQIIESGKLLLSNYPKGNQWYHNGIIVTGAIESFIEPSSSGQYSVEVTINSCTITSAEYRFVFAEIDKTNPNSIVTLSPNPATNKISIEIPDSFENVRVVEIINMSGQVVGTIDLHQENGRKKGEALLTNYSSGVYIVRIIGSRRTEEIRFVKL